MRERELRDPHPRDPRDIRDPRDLRDPRDPRDPREREYYHHSPPLAHAGPPLPPVSRISGPPVLGVFPPHGQPHAQHVQHPREYRTGDWRSYMSAPNGEHEYPR
jgi:hypothetical protein